MSFAGPSYLPNPTVKDDCIIISVKNFGVSLVKQEDILKKLVFMNNFEEISHWVELNSKNKKFIANPAGANDTDRMDCLFYVQEPIARAIKGQNERKNGRDHKLIKAVITADYARIADVLASTAWSYWQDHGFFSGKNLNNEIATISQIKNSEQNKEKKEFQIALIERVGAAVGFEKALKKGAFQSSFDFEETEEILKNIDFED